MAATQCIKACRPGQDNLFKFKPSNRMGKKGGLSDFDHVNVDGARRACLSISETADLLGFSLTTISRVNREWPEKEKISSEWHLCEKQKSLVDVRGARRMGRLVQDDRKATVTQPSFVTTKVCRISTICTGSPKLDNKRLEKSCLV